MAFHHSTELFTNVGERKYLSDEEGREFLRSSMHYSPPIRAFCFVLAYTGCRISEALMITHRHVDKDQKCIRLRTLKRRNGRIIWRSVPIPIALLTLLLCIPTEQDERLFPWSRTTAWRKVKLVMDNARIDGVKASPKALRHRFGVMATIHRIPDALIQRWMGHTKIENTAIYQQAIGPEERQLAEKLW